MQQESSDPSLKHFVKKNFKSLSAFLQVWPKIELMNTFYIKTIKYEFLNKFNYKNIKEIPKIKKIILNFGCKTTEIKPLASGLLALELITNQKGTLTKTKLPNILLKVKKGNPTGCKVTLRNKTMLNFFIRTILTIFPKLKDFNGFNISRQTNKNSLSYELEDTFSFNELEKQYYLFNNISKLNITIVTNCRVRKELLFLLKSFQFPIVLEM